MNKKTRKNRFKKNRQAERDRLRARFTAMMRLLGFASMLIATSGAFILIHDYLTQTKHFQVRQIEVTGNRRLTRQQVLDIAHIGPQTNILAVNLTTARKRLLADPWIADATVSRQIPSGLHVHIREEQPLAVLAMASNDAFLINPDGDVFGRMSSPVDDRWPRVNGLQHADLPVPGKTNSRAFEAVMAFLRLAAEQDSPLPLGEVRRIDMDPEIGVTVYTGADDRAVRLGFGHYRRKCAALGQLVARLRSESRLKEYRMIDLLDVNRIVITLASAGDADMDGKEV